jgi:hypothetical protein
METLSAPQAHTKSSRDPMHDRPSKQTADELHHSMESLYGLCQHGQRTALAPEARNAFRLMASWLENALWPVAS